MWCMVGICCGGVVLMDTLPIHYVRKWNSGFRSLHATDVKFLSPCIGGRCVDLMANSC